MSDKLFAVYLGGRAPRCNTELHDVVFVVGSSIEATYEQLMDLWFGSPGRLHLDSFMALDVVDGHRVRLASSRSAGDTKALYFINLPPAGPAAPPRPVNGYYVIPKPVIADYLARHPERA